MFVPSFCFKSTNFPFIVSWTFTVGAFAVPSYAADLSDTVITIPSLFTSSPFSVLVNGLAPITNVNW